MTDRKYDVLLREVLFQGYFRVERLHLQHELFAGGSTPVFTREIFHRSPHVAGALLFDPQHDKVVMVEQFRSGVLTNGEYPWLLEIPMGGVDAGETPEQAIRREVKEEAGCIVQDMLPIANYFTSPSGTSEQVHLYVARVNAPADGGIFGIKHDNEDIRVHVLDATRAISLLYANKIRDAQTLVALQWFATRHTDLRSRWLVSDVGTPII